MKYLVYRNNFNFNDFTFLKYDCVFNFKEISSISEVGFIYNKKSFYKKINFLNFFLFEKFLKILTKNGSKLKSLKFIFSSFNFFFFLFLFNSGGFFKKYQSTYNIYYFFSRTTNFFFNINYIFNWISEFNESIFNLKCESVPKKYRKKLKKKFLFKISYTYPLKRKNVVLRWFYLLSNKFTGVKFRSRIYFLLIDIFLKGKKSSLYLKKISIYKKAIFSKSN